MRRSVGLMLLAAATACSGPEPFPCTRNTECGESGRCEATGFCSFPDDTCPGGRRYGSLVPESLAGTCVEVSPAGTSGSTTGGSTTSSSAGSTTASGSSTTGPVDPPTTTGTSSTTDPGSTTSNSMGGSTSSGTSGGQTVCDTPFVDSFADAAIGAGWEVYDSGNTDHVMEETAGELRWTLAADETNLVGIRRDIEGDLAYVRAEIGTPPPSNGTHAQIGVLLIGSSDLWFIVWGAQEVQLRRGSDTVLAVSYAAGSFFELRVDPMALTVSASVDGSSWVEQGSVPVAESFTDANLQLYGQTWTDGVQEVAVSLNSIEWCSNSG